jgi:hypothetical protein
MKGGTSNLGGGSDHVPPWCTRVRFCKSAQRWQIAAPPTATPPTTCQDATVASIRHSPRIPPQPPQGGGLPIIAVSVQRSPPKNAAIESLSLFKRAPSSCLAPRMNLRRVKYKILTVISTQDTCISYVRYILEKQDIRYIYVCVCKICQVQDYTIRIAYSLSFWKGTSMYPKGHQLKIVPDDKTCSYGTTIMMSPLPSIDMDPTSISTDRLLGDNKTNKFSLWFANEVICDIIVILDAA